MSRPSSRRTDRFARAALAAAAVVVLTGCGSRALSRDALVDRYVDTLVDEGVPREVAECVIGGLFGEMTDDELRSFNTNGDELTPDQQARVAELTSQCAPDATLGA